LQSLLDGLVQAHKTLPELQFPLSIASYQHYIIAADDPWKDESATVFWQQQVYIYITVTMLRINSGTWVIHIQHMASLKLKHETPYTKLKESFTIFEVREYTPDPSCHLHLLC
jgi:hypothetical protein